MKLTEAQTKDCDADDDEPIHSKNDLPSIFAQAPDRQSHSQQCKQQGRRFAEQGGQGGQEALLERRAGAFVARLLAPVNVVVHRTGDDKRLEAGREGAQEAVDDGIELHEVQV